jgi:uncharacterized sulfatase
MTHPTSFRKHSADRAEATVNMSPKPSHGNRGRFLRASFMFITTLVGVSVEGRSEGSRDRPNILFCFADDWGRYAGAYAGRDGRPSLSDVVRTPHVDAVARAGVLFTHAHANAPSCTPSRSALVSGQYFWRTGRGAILHSAAWDSAIPSFPLLLRDAGYHIGKSHKVWSPGAPPDAPFGGQAYAYESAGRDFNRFSSVVTKLAADGVPVADAKAKLLAEVAGNFDAFLAQRAPGRPFLYWFGPTNTHRKWQKGSGRALWGIDPDQLQGKLPNHLPDVPEIREDVADYLGEVQALDAAIGVLLERLRASGEEKNTLIVLSGDHGMPGMPGGKNNLYAFGTAVPLVVKGPGIPADRVVDDFVNLTDLAPTFLELANVDVPKRTTGRSILPVLRSPRAGQVDPERTWVVTGRERHVAFAREDNLPYPERALRTAEFLYVRNFAPDRWPLGSPKFEFNGQAPAFRNLEESTYAAFADMDASPTKAWLISQRSDPRWRWHYDYGFAKRPAEELYDLRVDPAEVRNVADQPTYAERKRELAAALQRILIETDDPRVTGDGLTFERMPYIDPNPSATPPARKTGKSLQQLSAP